MKNLVLFVRYGEERYPEAMPSLPSFYHNHLNNQIDYDLIVIDNSLPADHREQKSDYLLLGGDNSRREFSAWTHAVKILGDRIPNYDLIHFATSAFRELYDKYLDEITLEGLRLTATTPCVLGHLDQYPEEIEVAGHPSRFWIRSCFYFMKPEGALRLGSWSSDLRPEEIFSQDFQRPFLESAPVSSRYQKYLLDWLTGEGHVDMKWHSVFKLSPETLQNFREKAMTILDEHMLRLRLEKIGYAPLDIKWFYLEGQKMASLQIPSGLEQLSIRRRGV